MTQPLLGPSEAEAAEAGVTLSEPTGANAGRPPLAPRLSTGRAKPRSPAAAHGGLAAAAAAAEDAHGAGTRQMFDKRTLRREGASVFAAAIAQWLASPANEAVAAAADDYDGGGAGRAAPTGRATVRAYIRKRPLFDNERERGEFDVVSVARAPRAGGVPADTPPRALTVHLCLHEADLRTMFVRHVSHTAAAVFGESSTDEAVHAHAMAPLVSSAAAGGVGALFSFGQTGSGKTHTCDALERMASAQLFNVSARAAAQRSAGQGWAEAGAEREQEQDWSRIGAGAGAGLEPDWSRTVARRTSAVHALAPPFAATRRLIARGPRPTARRFRSPLCVLPALAFLFHYCYGFRSSTSWAAVRACT